MAKFNVWVVDKNLECFLSQGKELGAYDQSFVQTRPLGTAIGGDIYEYRDVRRKHKVSCSWFGKISQWSQINKRISSCLHKAIVTCFSENQC